VDGDRRFAVRDRASGHVLSAKKFSMLLTARADSRDGEVVLTLPGGDAMAVDDPRTAATLSEWLGREVDIARPSEGEERPVFEGHLGTFLGQPGGFFDSRAVHLVTTSTLAALTTLHPDGRFDPRRFRPNIVLETTEPGFLEETWLGGTLELGDVLLEITKPCSRCVMTTHAQEDLLVDRDILRTINTHNDEHVGVYGIVRRPGVVRVGDDAVVGS
jgi:uncharacterized protein YcbX